MGKKLILIFTIIFFLFGAFSPVYSQTVDDLENQLDEINQEVGDKESEISKIQKEIETIKSSTASIDEKLTLVNRELKNVKKYFNELKSGVAKRKKEISGKEVILAIKQDQLNALSTYLYKTTKLGLLEYFFMENTGETLFQKILYKKYLISSYLDELRRNQQEYAEVLSEKQTLESEQKEVDKQLDTLEKMQNDLEDQMNELYGAISYRNSKAAQLKSQVTLLKNEMSDLQVAILVAKSGTPTGVGNVPSSGDFDSTYAGFQQNAPSGTFAVFSFGAYTHRMGMSQYGAQSRADIGHQTYTQILQYYYHKTPVHRNTSGNIKVLTANGVENMDFETKYMYGIAEMPSDWNIEALKAQAIATRTYAYGYYYNKTPICITQGCQVWSYSKYVNIKNGIAPKWKQAIEETEGMILSGVTTYYSAITGGYLTTSGWDTTDGKGGTGQWTTNAWESKGNSPWFYKAWYKDLSNRSCNRKAWLTQEEMADILNAYLVVKGIDLKGSVNTSKILPVTLQSCPISGLSGIPYSMSQMRDLLNNPVTSITGNPVTTNDSKANTTTVSFVTNRGLINITGKDFKQIFNMRVPGYISIPQDNYVFINVLRK